MQGTLDCIERQQPFFFSFLLSMIYPIPFKMMDLIFLQISLNKSLILASVAGLVSSLF